MFCCAIVWTRQNIDIVRSCVKIADLSEWKTTLRASHLMHTKERTQVREGSLLAFIFEFRIRDNEKHTVDRNTGQPTNKRLDEKKWQAALSLHVCVLFVQPILSGIICIYSHWNETVNDFHATIRAKDLIYLSLTQRVPVYQMRDFLLSIQIYKRALLWLWNVKTHFVATIKEYSFKWY